MTKNKKLLVGAMILAVIGAGGYLGLSQRAIARAQEKIQGILSENKITQAVRYKDISASLVTGSVTLHNVELRGQEGQGIPIKIASVRISDIDKENGVITGFHLRLNSLEIPLLKVFRQDWKRLKADPGVDISPPSPRFGFPSPTENPFSTISMIGMGYTTLGVNVDIKGKLDPETQEMSGKLQVDLNQALSLNVNFAMVGVNPRIFTLFAENFGDVLLDTASLETSQVQSILLPLKLRELHVHIRDAGLHERVLNTLAQTTLITNTTGNFAEKIAAHMFPKVSGSSLNKETVYGKNIAKELTFGTVLRAYLAKNNDLDFTTRTTTPVSLFKMMNSIFLGRPTIVPTFSNDNFLSSVRAKLTF